MNYPLFLALFFIPFFLYSEPPPQPLPPQAKIPLSIVIGEVLKNQWDILIAGEDIRRQAGVVQNAAGPFDTRLDSDATHVRMFNVQLDGLKLDKNGYTDTANMSLTKKSRIGTQTTVGARFYKTYNPILLFTNIPPTRRLSTFDLFFIIDQPLLRGFINNQDYIHEKVTKVEFRAVTFDFVQTVSNQIRDVMQTYWNLVAQGKLIEIRMKSQEQLKELVRYTKRLIEAGEFAATETFQQYAEIERELTQELAVQTDLNTTYQQLLYEMGRRDPRAKAPENLLLDNFPQVIATEKLYPLQDLLEIAWKNRADLMSAQLRAEETFLLLKEANNEVLPHLNLRGRADVLNSEVDPHVPNLFSASSSRNPEIDLAVTIEFSYPLCNNAALGNQRAVSAESRQAILTQEKLTETIRRNLTAVYQNHRTLIRELMAARNSVKWFQDNLNAEIKRLREGYSTIFIVIDFQRRLNDALSREVDVYRQYAQNFVELLYNTGTLVSYDECERVACIADFNDLNVVMGESNE